MRHIDQLISLRALTLSGFGTTCNELKGTQAHEFLLLQNGV